MVLDGFKVVTLHIIVVCICFSNSGELLGACHSKDIQILLGPTDHKDHLSE